MYALTAANNDHNAGIPQAYVNQAKVKCLADVLLGLNIILRQIAFRLNLLMRSRLKPVFHFNRIVAKRSVFLCFLTTRVELMTSTQKKMLRYVTIIDILYTVH
jgi:hypothetical protein